MDSIDVKILGCLKENARQNASAIGEYVNMSVSCHRADQKAGEQRRYPAIYSAAGYQKDRQGYFSLYLCQPGASEIQ